MELNTNIYQHIKQLLSEAGLKATHSRIAVLHALMSMDEHPTVDKIFSTISKNNPSISLGSIYRILEKLIEANLANCVASEDGIKRFDAKMEPHSHIYSVNTDEIQDYNDEELNDLIKAYFAKKQINNFKITEIKLQINGEKDDQTKKVTII